MLYGVATKCRDPILRREAIALMLSSHWKEGIWDSILCGRTATWIMDMEEKGMDDDGFIPESSRCFGEVFDLDMPRGTAVVRCQQNVSDPAGSTERKVTINW
jgi:hypothetical protein